MFQLAERHKASTRRDPIYNAPNLPDASLGTSTGTLENPAARIHLGRMIYSGQIMPDFLFRLICIFVMSAAGFSIDYLSPIPGFLSDKLGLIGGGLAIMLTNWISADTARDWLMARQQAGPLGQVDLQPDVLISRPGTPLETRVPRKQGLQYRILVREPSRPNAPTLYGFAIHDGEAERGVLDPAFSGQDLSHALVLISLWAQGDRAFRLALASLLLEHSDSRRYSDIERIFNTSLRPGEGIGLLLDKRDKDKLGGLHPLDAVGHLARDDAIEIAMDSSKPEKLDDVADIIAPVLGEMTATVSECSRMGYDALITIHPDRFS